MSKKDDGIAATSAPGQMQAHGRLTITGSGNLTATTSVAEAIVSVTQNVSRADIDWYLDQLKRLDMPKHIALAQGVASPKALGIQTTLSAEVAKGMAGASYKDREVGGHRQRPHLQTLRRRGA